MLLLLLACAPAPKDTAPADDTALDSGAETGEDSETAGDSESGADSGGDSGEESGDSEVPDPVVLSEASLSVHPVVGSLLVARWTQSAAAEVSVRYGLPDEALGASPPTWREAGTHEQLLVGIPYDADVEAQVVAEGEGGPVESAPLTAHTDPLPEGVPAPVLNASDPSAWGAEDRWLLIGLSSGGEGWASDGFWKLVLDRKGRVVWAHETPDEYRTFYMQPSRDGTHVVWDEDTFWTDFDDGAGSVVHRMTLDGTVLATIPTPGLHHAFLDLGEDRILWGGADDGREVLYERVGAGESREVWDCTAFWSSHGASTRCDGNALHWDEASDTVLFSSDNEHSIAQVTRADGEVLRTFGQLDGSYTFAEGTEPFWKQHSPNWTPEGTLLLSCWAGERDAEIVAREFEVDEERQELREVWRCGDGTGTTGRYAGEAHRLGSGNTLLNDGEGGHLREYTPDCDVAWHLEWPYANLLGRAVFVSDLYALLP